MRTSIQLSLLLPVLYLAATGCSMCHCPANLVLKVDVNTFAEGCSNTGLISSMSVVPYVAGDPRVLISLGCHRRRWKQPML